jgi:hypothetical protein
MILFTIVGFEGIRHVGNTLRPPQHIAGTWRLTPPMNSSSCRPLEFQETGEALLQIEQSGRYLHLAFTDTRQTKMPVRFDGNTLRGNEVSVPGCAPYTQWRLAGRLIDNQLELTFSPIQHVSVATNLAFSLVATRSAPAAQQSSSTS